MTTEHLILLTLLDYRGEHGGELALAFAAGCVATWAFMKIMYDERIVEIRALMALQKKQCDEDRLESSMSEARLWERIHQLETILMTTGNAATRAQLQKVAGEGD